MCWTFSLFGEVVAHDVVVSRTRFAEIGYISLSLTVLNIAAIFLTGFLVFRTKASLKFDTHSQDLEAAQEYYRTLRFTKKEKQALVEALNEVKVSRTDYMITPHD